MSEKQEIRVEEYRSLHDEHMRNRSYMFERPLIILGVMLVAMQFIIDSSIGQFILAGFIALLYYNLSFIGNRMESDARIVAYLLLVHEPDSTKKWKGWENSLDTYRQERDKIVKKITRKFKKDSLKSDRNQVFRFYPGIWWVHCVITVGILMVAIIRCFLVKESDPNSIYVYIGAGFVLVVFFLISWLVIKYKLTPLKYDSSLETEKKIWEQVLEDK